MRRNNILRYLLYFTVAFAGCTTYFITSEIAHKVSEVQVWVDYMPGALPRTHAILRCALENRTDDTLKIIYAIGTIIDARSTSEIRRFNCQIGLDEVKKKDLVMPPNTRLNVAFESPQTVVPFDVKLYDKVSMVIKAECSNDKVLVINSEIVTPVRTE